MSTPWSGDRAGERKSARVGERKSSPISGRISAPPSEVLDAQVLRGQFDHEVANLLPHYVSIEQTLIAEYLRMDILSAADAAALMRALSTVNAESIVADPAQNFSDIAFAIERRVVDQLSAVPPRWHLDRSRNDLQATAQRMYARQRLTEIVEELLAMTTAALGLADRHPTDPMPGQTHLQAAQVISPAFWLTALAGETLDSLTALETTYDRLDRCPLGAGAMAGQELPWDRDLMASALGFRRPEPHALSAVASRGWALSLTAALSNWGVVLSRFSTDLMTWAGGAHRFVELPDELAGISSAMPQKKNYPVLERIRGRTAHLTALHLDAAIGQRNTSYTNLVEVSKEAGAFLPAALDCASSIAVLMTTVLQHLRLDTALMRRDCDTDFLGGFTLANLLTQYGDVPWRTAQVVAGSYVVDRLAADAPPNRTDPATLARLLAEHGRQVTGLGQLLDRAFDTGKALAGKLSAGSTSPTAVAAETDRLREEWSDATGRWSQRATRVTGALAATAASAGGGDSR